MAECGYSGNVTTTKLDVRRALRAVRRERKPQGFTLDKLSADSGVDRAAIHRIESVEKYPDYEPGIETVARLVDAMGLTLSEFFSRVEGFDRDALATAVREYGLEALLTPPPQRTRNALHALRLLDVMNDEGQQKSMDLLQSLSRVFPREPPQQAPARTIRTSPEIARKERGKR